MRIIEGGVLAAKQSFVDSSGDPLLPQEYGQGPLVTLLDDSSDIVLEANAIPISETPGMWSVDIAVPELGLRDEVQMQLFWVFEDEVGNTHRVVQEVIVEPVREHRITDVVVAFLTEGTVEFDLVVPWHVNEGDTVEFHLSINNTEIATYSSNDNDVKLLNRFSNRTEYRLPISGWPQLLAPISVIATYKAINIAIANSNKITTFKLWTATPQVLVAASMLQDFVDRARLENVIPELEYTQSDLILYLHRGLAMFNSLPPRATNISGTNMQGPFLDCWLVCAAIQALSAQFLAEGSLAFDFSGQTVSLNMDRTPAIESTLGRLEGQLNTIVMPFKKLMGRAGVIDGDGSQGGRVMDGAQRFGVLGVTTSPTTRFGRGSYNGQQRIWMQAHYGLHR